MTGSMKSLARVRVHGVVAQRLQVVQLLALVHTRDLGRVDPKLARRADDLSSTWVMFCTYVTAKPRA